MTPAELDAIEARAKAATEGPWDVARSLYEQRRMVTGIGRPDAGITPPYDRSDLEGGVASCDGCGIGTDADCDFIAHARADVPALVAEVRRLRGALERIHAIDVDLMRVAQPYEGDLERMRVEREALGIPITAQDEA